MHQLVQRQREYFNTGVSVPKQFRIQQLKKLRSALKENEAALFEAIYSDFKKSQFDTYVTELALVYQDIDEAIRKMDNWTRKKRVRTNLVNFPARSYIVPEPLGVSLIIGAWNYPIQLSLAPAVAAMAAGCTVVMKPSELPARTSTALANIIAEAFPAEYFSVVQGGVPETTELLNQKFDKIFFTGSTHVGKIVYKAAADHLTPVTLELGGKSPVFVTENCSSLKLAARRIVWGAFLNAGQTCNSPDYILVHRSKEAKFLELCKKEIAKRQIAVENGNYSQIIDERNFDRLAALIDPEKVYCGGTADRERRIIEPTILQQVEFDDEVMQDEIFGPILPFIVYDELDDAINSVRKIPKPLSCYIFSNNSNEKKKVLERISFGGGGANDVVSYIANPHLPFGGVGNSGIGKYHGEAGFQAFSNYKGILEKGNWLELPLKYYPYSDIKLWWIKQFFKF